MMGSINESDLINYITSPILSSIDDDNLRLENEENHHQQLHHQIPQLSTTRSFNSGELFLSNDLNHQYLGNNQTQTQQQQQQLSSNDSIANFISPQFSRLTTTDDGKINDNNNRLDNFIHQPATTSAHNSFLSLGIPSRSNTMSPSNSRFYDNSNNNNSNNSNSNNNNNDNNSNNTSILGQAGSRTSLIGSATTSANLFNSADSFIQRPMSAMDFSTTTSHTSTGAGGAHHNNRPFALQVPSFNKFNSSQDFTIQQQFPHHQQQQRQTFPKTSVNFNTELFDFKLWLENLNSKQQLYVVDLITKTIDVENLKIMKRKLDTSLQSTSSLEISNHELLGQIRPKSADIIVQNQNQNVKNHDYLQYQHLKNSNNLHSPGIGFFPTQQFESSNFTPQRRTPGAGIDYTNAQQPAAQRPPQQQQQQQQQQKNRVGSGGNNNNNNNQSSSTSQQQQQQNQNPNNPMNSYTNQRPRSPMNYEDLSNQNFLKLNALSTIQSRAQLDNGKRHDERGRSNQFQNMYNNTTTNNNNGIQGQQQQQQQQQSNNINNTNSSNRYKPSSVPPIGRNSTHHHDKSNRRSGTPLSATSTPSATLSSSSTSSSSSSGLQQPQPTSSEANKILNDSLLKLASINNIKAAQQLHQFQTPVQSPSISSSSPILGAAGIDSPVSKSPMPKDIASLELLNNIPQWLKILRLHKYTEILSSLDWKIMINLSEEELDEMGISTLGARRKLLKAFSVVKESYEKGEIN